MKKIVGLTKKALNYKFKYFSGCTYVCMFDTATNKYEFIENFYPWRKFQFSTKEELEMFENQYKLEGGK